MGDRDLGREWDESYLNGMWNHMEAEEARYRALMSLLPTSTASAHVLDVGCGPGHLLSFFRGFMSYTGVDISRVAIERAPAGPDITYHVVPLESFAPQRLFTLIVFNEVLYYCAYDRIIPRYRDFLDAGGYVLSSVYHGPGQSAADTAGIQRVLDAELELIERRFVTHLGPIGWMASVHRRPRPVID